MGVDVSEQTTADRVMLWLFSLASLAGLAWLWLNMDIDSMLTKVIVVGALWAVWIAIVGVAVALIALFLGMLGVMAKPFRR